MRPPGSGWLHACCDAEPPFCPDGESATGKSIPSAAGLRRVGVGSNGSHPYFGNSASTHTCAFWVVT